MEGYIERLLEKFKGVVNVGPTEWQALSPLRDEEVPSVRIALGPDGRILLHDFGGGSSRDVLKAVGLDFRALYPRWDESPMRSAETLDELTPTNETVKNPALWHRVYSEFLAGLGGHEPLFPQHFRELSRRGFDSDVAVSWGYRTLSWFRANGAIQRLMAYDPMLTADVLSSVPGFRRHKSGHLESAVDSGLVFPVYSASGKIQALKVWTGGFPKYQWFSGGGSPSCGSPCHVRRGQVPECREYDEVVIVEGVLKADVCRFFKNEYTFIGIPGVSSWRSVLPVLEELKPTKVYVAFDMDRLVKKEVQTCCDNLVRHVREKYGTEVWSWPSQYKGLDDCYQAGITPLRGDHAHRAIDYIEMKPDLTLQLLERNVKESQIALEAYRAKSK